jgi:hypothetical protein
MNTYCKMNCPLCGQIISSNGLSQNSHMRMHIREGYFVQVASHPNEYDRTDKTMDKKVYQKEHPERAYNDDDYFPITGNAQDAKLRKDLYSKMVDRKKNTPCVEQA